MRKAGAMLLTRLAPIPFVAGLLATAATAAPAGAGQGEILWDSFGVPHVYAKTEAGIFHGSAMRRRRATAISSSAFMARRGRGPPNIGAPNTKPATDG